jgi:hypothetical protein
MQLQLFALGKKKHSNNKKALAHVNDCARFVIDEQLSIKNHLSFQRASNTRKLFNLGHFSILNFLSWRNDVVHDGNHNNSFRNHQVQLVIASWSENILIKQNHW